MYGLLLDSKFSDEMEFGPAGRFLPSDRDLEGRIIRFKTNPQTQDSPGLDYSGIDDFFRDRGNINPDGSATRLYTEFLLEKFFEKLETTGYFDAVTYIEGEPGAIVKGREHSFKFLDQGRVIGAYLGDESRPVTRIARLADLRRGKKRQVVICDLQTSRKPNLKMGLRFKAALDLLHSSGQRDYTLSYMLVFSKDTFQSILSSKKRYNKERAPEEQPFVESYLSRHPANLILVYSARTDWITRAAQEVMDRISGTA